MSSSDDIEGYAARFYAPQVSECTCMYTVKFCGRYSVHTTWIQHAQTRLEIKCSGNCMVNGAHAFRFV